MNNTEAQNLTKLANIRRIVTYCEETFIDGGKEAQVPLKLFAVAADNQSADGQMQTTASIQTAKAKCADIGFTPGTEGFGKCVLQLSK